jgi:hypothetical protein
MGGQELAIHVSRIAPATRILFMSGFSDDPDVQRLLSSSIFLAKPFTAATLELKVRQTLEQPWAGLPSSGPGSSRV